MNTIPYRILNPNIEPNIGPDSEPYIEPNIQPKIECNIACNIGSQRFWTKITTTKTTTTTKILMGFDTIEINLVFISMIVLNDKLLQIVVNQTEFICLHSFSIYQIDFCSRNV